mgnify:CR=1 FL=1
MPKSHIIPDPYPKTIGVPAMTIFVPEDFRGDAKIVWWHSNRSHESDKQWITCDANSLLQGLFRDVCGGTRPGALFDARVVALVVHAFYRARIEAAARLEAAYEWRPYPP